MQLKTTIFYKRKKVPLNRVSSCAELAALCNNGEIEKINKNYLCGCEETLENLNIEGNDK